MTTFTEGFIYNTAKDYDMAVSTVEYYAEKSEGYRDFYANLESHLVLTRD